MKKITQEQKEQLLNLNDSRVNEILGVKELEVGRWYLNGNGKTLFCYGERYGFNMLGGWSSRIGKVYDDRLVEATHEEVENALIAEAKRRGVKKGVILNRTWINANNSIIKVIEGNFKLKDNRLLADGREVFVDGKWAEVIEEPKVEYIANIWSEEEVVRKAYTILPKGEILYIEGGKILVGDGVSEIKELLNNRREEIINQINELLKQL